MTRSTAAKMLLALIGSLGLVWNAFAQAPQLGAIDKSFVDAAASNGLAEIQPAKLALQRANRQAVREFADRLGKDHTKANLELRKMTDSHGINVAQEMGPYQVAAKRLNELDGAAFDRAYLQHVSQEHEKAVVQFSKAAQEGQNSQRKAFAAKMLPILWEHLQTAQESVAQG